MHITPSRGHRLLAMQKGRNSVVVGNNVQDHRMIDWYVNNI